MTWRWQSTCSACAYVGSQLGSGTSCPAHAGNWVRPHPPAEATVDESAAAARPTADQPWPFTRLQYARLLLLRGRVRDRHQTATSDPGQAAMSVESDTWRYLSSTPPLLRQVRSMYTASLSDDMRALLGGGLTLMFFLVLFALGQLQEIFRATGLR